MYHRWICHLSSRYLTVLFDFCCLLCQDTYHTQGLFHCFLFSSISIHPSAPWQDYWFSYHSLLFTEQCLFWLFLFDGVCCPFPCWQWVDLLQYNCMNTFLRIYRFLHTCNYEDVFLENLCWCVLFPCYIVQGGGIYSRLFSL